MINIGISGFGRIGRCILRAAFESPGYRKRVRVTMVNSLMSLEQSAHLMRYDSTHGLFGFEVEVNEADNELIIDGVPVKVIAERDPTKITWKDAGGKNVDVLCECTGKFKSYDAAEAHLRGGAGKVLISAPADGDVDATVVYGVNNDSLRPGHRVVSAASCTTNCLAPVVSTLHDAIGVKHGLLTTVHAYTGDQKLVDASHSDMRRARAAAHSMIPTKTGAAKAVGIVLPDLAGKLHGYAVRVPTLNVSMVDFNFVVRRATDTEEVNAALRSAAESQLRGVMAYCEAPLVSADFNHHPASSIVDAGLTQVMEGELVKVVAWYDNEWGFSNRMIDLAIAMAGE